MNVVLETLYLYLITIFQSTDYTNNVEDVLNIVYNRVPKVFDYIFRIPENDNNSDEVTDYKVYE